MFWSKLLPLIVLFSAVVQSVEPPADATEKVAIAGSGHPLIDYEVLTHDNCTNLSIADMRVIISYYPRLKVMCQAEGTVLIPEKLPLPENIESTDPEKGLWNKLTDVKTYTFNEFMLVSETESTKAAIPISPCLRTVGQGMGTYELTFSLTFLLDLMGSIKRDLPWFINSGELKATMSLNDEVAYSSICGFQQNRVRPLAEVATLRTHQKVRTWTIVKTKVPEIQYGPWQDLHRVRLLADSIMASCVSEKYVPDICSWTNDDVFSNLSGKLSPPTKETKE
ncbi:hypothetical protein JCM33374_g4994 [Metschnikowia sp. JCM 33374]|nr:hypothetical protein JCM33374_g4994 [Metschnikowia sp. JCM 33374]